MTREVEYLKKLNKILDNENQVLREKLTLSESVVETLFSHAKEAEKWKRCSPTLKKQRNENR